MNKKFGVPFSGAADLETDSGEDAAKAQPFPKEQVDESREGAMRGDPKYAMKADCVMMQSTVDASSGFTKWKKMESVE